LKGFADLLDKRWIEFLDDTTDLLESHLHLLELHLGNSVPVFDLMFYSRFICCFEVALEQLQSLKLGRIVVCAWSRFLNKLHDLSKCQLSVILFVDFQAYPELPFDPIILRLLAILLLVKQTAHLH
jgi:hypothetical protein